MHCLQCKVTMVIMLAYCHEVCVHCINGQNGMLLVCI